MCGGDPKNQTEAIDELKVFSTCVEVILSIDSLNVSNGSILHVCGGDPDIFN